MAFSDLDWSELDDLRQLKEKHLREIKWLRAALHKLFYRHPPLPALSDEEYEMIRPLIGSVKEVGDSE